MKNQNHIYVFCGWKISIFVLIFAVDPLSQMENNDLVRIKKKMLVLYICYGITIYKKANKKRRKFYIIVTET